MALPRQMLADVLTAYASHRVDNGALRRSFAEPVHVFPPITEAERAASEKAGWWQERCDDALAGAWTILSHLLAKHALLQSEGRFSLSEFRDVEGPQGRELVAMLRWTPAPRSEA